MRFIYRLSGLGFRVRDLGLTVGLELFQPGGLFRLANHKARNPKPSAK